MQDIDNFEKLFFDNLLFMSKAKVISKVIYSFMRFLFFKLLINPIFSDFRISNIMDLYRTKELEIEGEPCSSRSSTKKGIRKSMTPFSTDEEFKPLPRILPRRSAALRAPLCYEEEDDDASTINARTTRSGRQIKANSKFKS